MAKTSSKKSFHDLAQALIDSSMAAQQLNARSLILTIFGDSVSAHGGMIWLGSLISLVKPLGINQRLVRTSVFRLGEKDILQSRQVGRRSFYSLTDRGFRQFSHAAERIYRHENAAWDGEWRLVFTNLNKIKNRQREAFKKELNWLGFSRLSNGVFGHPTVDIDEVRQVVTEMGLQDSILLMEASNRNEDPLAASGRLVRHAFKFDEIDDEYLDYIKQFENLVDASPVANARDDELCFLVRTLLIHRYRHLLLQEPELPRELVPADSASHRARSLTADLYRNISAAAERHFIAVGESEKGALPPVSDEFHTRFAGV